MRLFDFLKKKDYQLPDTLKPKLCSTVIPHEISNKIEEVNWIDFGTAYGNAGNTIPYYLKNLYCADTKIAMDATHQLWCSLCHQHAYISDAALPAYDILKEGLLVLDDDLKCEILDIIKGFAFCTSQEYYTSPNELVAWEKELQQKLISDRTIFESFKNHTDLSIAELAKQICQFLDNTKQ
jgi:hypothetical protein